MRLPGTEDGRRAANFVRARNASSLGDAGDAGDTVATPAAVDFGPVHRGLPGRFPVLPCVPVSHVILFSGDTDFMRGSFLSGN